MNQAQHYNPAKPTVIIVDFSQATRTGYPTEAAAVVDDNNKPIVFDNKKKAARYAMTQLEVWMHELMYYVNEKPRMNWGDMQATDYKRCLRCNGFLRPGKSKYVSVGDDEIELNTYVCPECDKER
jgi:uncharacterized protein with PIN domain